MRPFLVLLISLLLCAPSVAQDATDDREDKAKAAYAEGKRLYDVGAFADAHQQFATAYRLKPAPLLLFNMAQCKRQLKEHERAIFLFERYLSEDPRSRDRRLVERLIEEEKARLEARRQAAKTDDEKRADLAELEAELQKKIEALQAEQRTQTTQVTEAQLARRQAELDAIEAKTAELEAMSTQLEAMTAEDAARRQELARQQDELKKLAATMRAEREALAKQRADDEARAKAEAEAEAEAEAGWWIWPTVGVGAAGAAAATVAAVATASVVAVVVVSQPNHTADWRE